MAGVEPEPQNRELEPAGLMTPDQISLQPDRSSRFPSARLSYRVRALQGALHNVSQPGLRVLGGLLVAIVGTGCIAPPDVSGASKAEAAGNHRLFLPENARGAHGMSNGVIPREVPTPTITPNPQVTPTRIQTPIPTPEPTPTVLPEGAYYAPWPSEFVAAMNRTVVLDGVRLVKSKVTPSEQPGCITACYLQHKKEVWIITPPLDPNAGPEFVNMAHELGHSHQQKIRELQGKATWEQTSQYQDFMATLNRFNAWLKARGDQEWMQDPYELFANIFAGYILGDSAFTNEPADWNRWVPNPYQFPELQSFMDRWAKKT